MKAIAVYLKITEGGLATKPAPLQAGDIPMKTGPSIDQANCSACDGGDGKGAAELFPALAGSTLIRQRSAETLVRRARATRAGVPHGRQGAVWFCRQ